MINLFRQLDIQAFLFINHLPHNIIFDSFFGFFTAVGYFGLIWFTLGLIIYLKEKKRDKRLMLSLILSGLLSLILGELMIKNIIARFRPQFIIPDIILPYNIALSFSFPSGHATIAFAAALILAKKHKKIAWIYYLLATLISFSRIYLGKHYPSDVLAGMLLGSFIGYTSLKIVNWKRN